jgi:hypothetical protein
VHTHKYSHKNDKCVLRKIFRSQLLATLLFPVRKLAFRFQLGDSVGPRMKQYDADLRKFYERINDHCLYKKATQNMRLLTSYSIKRKSGTAVRHGWRSGGDRGCSIYAFTLALEGGERSASRPGRVLPLGKGPPVPIVQEAGWAPERVWSQRPGALKVLCLCWGLNSGRLVRSETLYWLSYPAHIYSINTYINLTDRFNIALS